MVKFKKTLILLMLVILVLSLSSCGGETIIEKEIKYKDLGIHLNEGMLIPKLPTGYADVECYLTFPKYDKGEGGDPKSFYFKKSKLIDSPSLAGTINPLVMAPISQSKYKEDKYNPYANGYYVTANSSYQNEYGEINKEFELKARFKSKYKKAEPGDDVNYYEYSNLMVREGYRITFYVESNIVWHENYFDDEIEYDNMTQAEKNQLNEGVKLLDTYEVYYTVTIEDVIYNIRIKTNYSIDIANKDIESIISSMNKQIKKRNQRAE